MILKDNVTRLAVKKICCKSIKKVNYKNFVKNEYKSYNILFKCIILLKIIMWFLIVHNYFNLIFI